MCMKQALSVLIAAAMLAYAIEPVSILLHFYLNRASIAQTLCENRNNPSLHCEGKCYLKKQLERASEEQQQPARKQFREKDELVTIHRTVVSNWFLLPETRVPVGSIAYALHLSALPDRPDRPPAA